MLKKVSSALLVVLALVLFVSAGYLAGLTSLQGRFATFSFSSASRLIYVSPTGTGTGTTPLDPADFFLTIGALQGGEIVKMDGGVYPISGTLSVREDVTIEGIPGQTIIDCAGMYWNSPCLRIRAQVDLSHVGIINYSYGIRVDDSLIARDIHVHSPNYSIPSAIVLADPSANLELKESVLSGVVSTGTGGMPQGFGVHSFHSNSALIHDNQFTHFNAPISLDSAGSTDEVYNNKIANCIKGFQATQESTRNVYSNKIVDCEYGMVFAGAGSTNAYQNLIRRSSYAGMAIGSEPSSVSNIQFYENVIDDARYGIQIANYATAVTADKIYENEILNAYDAAIYIFGNDNTEIYQNLISSSHDGLRIEPGGFYLPAGTVSTVFENNVIEQPSGEAIWVEDSFARIAYNTMVGGVSDAVVSDGADQSEYSNNLVYDFAGDGFKILSSALPSLAYNNSFATRVDFFGVYTDLGGNRSVNPAFISPTDYDLSGGSPLIDEGGHYFVTEDFDGITRKFPDIGAYEF